MGRGGGRPAVLPMRCLPAHLLTAAACASASCLPANDLCGLPMRLPLPAASLLWLRMGC